MVNISALIWVAGPVFATVAIILGVGCHDQAATSLSPVHPIVDSSLQALRQVESYGFSEFLKTERTGDGHHKTGDQVHFDGSYRSPNQVERTGARSSQVGYLPNRSPGTELRAVSIGDVGYISDIRLGTVASSRPVYFLLRSDGFGSLFKDSELPHEVLLRLSTTAGRLSVTQEEVDGYDLYKLYGSRTERFRWEETYVEAEGQRYSTGRRRVLDRKGDHLIERTYSLWVGTDDHLPRRMHYTERWEQPKCRICPTGSVHAWTTELVYEFLNYNEPVVIETPVLSPEPATTQGPFGPMYLFQVKDAPVSIEFPAGWGWPPPQELLSLQRHAYSGIQRVGLHAEFNISEHIFSAGSIRSSNPCPNPPMTQSDETVCRAVEELVGGLERGEVPLGTVARIHGLSELKRRGFDVAILSEEVRETRQGIPMAITEFSKEWVGELKQIGLQMTLVYELPVPLECWQYYTCAHGALIVTYQTLEEDYEGKYSQFEKLGEMIYYTFTTARIEEAP